MKIEKLAKILNELFPLTLQEKYDNAGAQIIFPEEEIKSVLISLDIDRDTVREAVERGCNIIIAHHPFFFKPISRIDSSDPRSSLILELIERKISVYSVHTNLDKIFYDRLERVLQFKHVKILFETDSLDDGKSAGFGTLSALKAPMLLSDLLEVVKNRLKLDFIIYSGELSSSVANIALLNGAGGNSTEKIIKDNDIDCIITGDVGYHNSKFALDYGVSLIDAGHFGTERILLDFLKEMIQDYLTNNSAVNDISLYVSEKERNPLKVFV